MHFVRSSQSNTATDTDVKTHAEHTAAAAEHIGHARWPTARHANGQWQSTRVTYWSYRSVRPMTKTHITALDNTSAFHNCFVQRDSVSGTRHKKKISRKPTYLLLSWPGKSKVKSKKGKTEGNLHELAIIRTRKNATVMTCWKSVKLEMSIYSSPTWNSDMAPTIGSDPCRQNGSSKQCLVMPGCPGAFLSRP